MGHARYQVARLIFYQLNDFAANHHGVSNPAHGLRRSRIAYAKPHAHRNADMLADSRQHGFYGCSVEVARTSNAFE